MTYYLDNNVTNPYQLWQSMGSPDYPTPEQFRRLRSMEVTKQTTLILRQLDRSAVVCVNKIKSPLARIIPMTRMMAVSGCDLT